MDRETHRFSGMIVLAPTGEDELVVALMKDGIVGEPIAATAWGFARKKVTARWWFSDKPCTFEEAHKDALETVMGISESKFGARYSELSGYLWTDEDFRIGGHDMIAILRNNVGKYLNMEVVLHKF